MVRGKHQPTSATKSANRRNRDFGPLKNKEAANCGYIAQATTYYYSPIVLWGTGFTEQMAVGGGGLR
jgi:hypothetical protein